MLLPPSLPPPSGSLPAEGLSLTRHLGNPSQPGHSVTGRREGYGDPESALHSILMSSQRCPLLALLIAKEVVKDPGKAAWVSGSWSWTQTWR